MNLYFPAMIWENNCAVVGAPNGWNPHNLKRKKEIKKHEWMNGEKKKIHEENKNEWRIINQQKWTIINKHEWTIKNKNEQ